MSTITLDHVDFHYSAPYAEVFADLSLAIDTAWRTTLVGRNGRGKSTLLRLISGELTPTRGVVHGPLRCRRVAHPTDAMGSTRMTIRRAVGPFESWEQEMERLLADGSEHALARYGDVLEQYQDAGGFTLDAAIDREVAALGLDDAMLDRPYGSLSGGEQTRAMIAALFLVPDLFPLLDEPTNHLDLPGRMMLAEYLATKRGFIVVSHDRELLDTCADHVVALERTGARVVAGNYSTWREQHELETASEQHRDGVLRREIAGLERAAKRTRTWSFAVERTKRGAYDKGYIGHKSAKMMKRALQVEARAEAAVDAKRALLRNVEQEKSLRIETSGRGPDVVASLDDATVHFDGRAVLERLSLTIRKGERVALVGANGSGKTTAVRALLGEVGLASGTAWHPARLRVGRSHQTPRWSHGALREHLRSEGIDETKLRFLMAAMGVCGDIFDRPLETFSEGERKKADLCRSLVEPCDLYIWDEPMNFVDVLAREQIERAVVEHAPTLLFIEHDARFIDAVATRVVEM